MLRLRIPWLAPFFTVIAEPVVGDHDAQLSQARSVCMVVQMVHLNGGLHFGSECHGMSGSGSGRNIPRVRRLVEEVREVSVVLAVQRELGAVVGLDRPRARVVEIPGVFVQCGGEQPHAQRGNNPDIPDPSLMDGAVGGRNVDQFVASAGRDGGATGAGDRAMTAVGDDVEFAFIERHVDVGVRVDVPAHAAAGAGGGRLVARGREHRRCPERRVRGAVVGVLEDHGDPRRAHPVVWVGHEDGEQSEYDDRSAHHGPRDLRSVARHGCQACSERVPIERLRVDDRRRHRATRRDSRHRIRRHPGTHGDTPV